MKPTTWLQLWKRIGKQPLRLTRGNYVTVEIDGQRVECALVFEHNGSKWFLKPIKKKKVLTGKEEENGTKEQQ